MMNDGNDGDGDDGDGDSFLSCDAESVCHLSWRHHHHHHDHHHHHHHHHHILSCAIYHGGKRDAHGGDDGVSVTMISQVDDSDCDGGGDGGDGGEWGVCVSETKVWVGGVNSEGRGGVGSERGERVVGDGLWRVGCGIGGWCVVMGRVGSSWSCRIESWWVVLGRTGSYWVVL